jgi:carbonic anhydrase/acetyltransferase-like protein (isoleucine patch superfamily)
VVKSGEIFAGAPAKLLRKLSAEEKGFVAASADNYAKLANEHRWAKQAQKGLACTAAQGL